MHIIEVIRSLHAKGYKIHLLSNIGARFFDKMRQREELQEFFDTCFDNIVCSARKLYLVY